MKYLIEKYTQQGTEFAGVVANATLTKSYIPMAKDALLKGRTVESIHLTGKLIMDIKVRFPAGSQFTTSDVKEILFVEQHNLTVVTTKNSTYFVEGDLLSDYGITSLFVEGQTLVELASQGSLELSGNHFVEV